MIVRPILAVAQVELIRLMRSRMTFTLLLLVPVLQVILFGTAIRPEPTSVRVAVAAPSAVSAASVIKAIRADHHFQLIGPVLPPGGAATAVKHGEALIAIEIPALPSFANPMAPHVPVRIVVDATNPGLTQAAVARIEARYWRELAERADAGGPGIQVERLFNRDARADWAFLPALSGVTVMIAMIMLGSLAVSREREGGSWETLRSLPVSGFAVMVGKILPGILLGSVQGILVLGIGFALFDVPARGSIAGLATLLPLFAAAHLVIGYL
ncbi:MAG: hypothetical protein RL367_2576, partial [Pseudomonadota bacterium]